MTLDLRRASFSATLGHGLESTSATSAEEELESRRRQRQQNGNGRNTLDRQERSPTEKPHEAKASEFGVAWFLCFVPFDT